MANLVRFVGGPLDGEEKSHPHDVRPIPVVSRAILDDLGNRIAVAFYELQPGDSPPTIYAHSRTLDNEQFRKATARLPAGD